MSAFEHMLKLHHIVKKNKWFLQHLFYFILFQLFRRKKEMQ